MERKPVVSSNLVSVGYDPESLTCEIEFRGGNVYRYLGMTPERHQAFLEAPSLGKHFHQHIRGKYVTEKMTPAPEGAANVGFPAPG